MSLIVKDSGGGGDFEMPPEGNHVAVCYQIIDLGPQNTDYGVKSKIRISWELTHELMTTGDSAGKPFSVSKKYTPSLNEKAILFKDLVSWRGRQFTTEELDSFDLANILGAPCMVNVTYNKSQDGSKTYANVSAITQMPKGMEKPAPVNPLVKFDSTDHTPEEYQALPEWLRKTINLPDPDPMEAAYSMSQKGNDPDQLEDMDIPF